MPRFLFGIFALCLLWWFLRRRLADTDVVQRTRRPRLFNEDPGDISVRSADNVRLLSDDQLRAYEEE